jgi:hypothetical protein
MKLSRSIICAIIHTELFPRCTMALVLINSQNEIRGMIKSV